MFPRVVRDLHHIQLQTFVALSDAVNTSDVRTLLVHQLHQLLAKNVSASLLCRRLIYFYLSASFRRR